MTPEDEREFLDHVEMRAEHYIEVISGRYADPDRSNPLSAQERFRNLLSPWFVKGLIARNKQVWMLQAALRQVKRAGSLKEAKERADEALKMLDSQRTPALEKAVRRN